MDGLTELLKVQVDFNQSHLLFPRLVQWLLGILLAMIAVVHAPRWLARVRRPAATARPPGARTPVDWKRLPQPEADFFAHLVGGGPLVEAGKVQDEREVLVFGQEAECYRGVPATACGRDAGETSRSPPVWP